MGKLGAWCKSVVRAWFCKAALLVLLVVALLPGHAQVALGQSLQGAVYDRVIKSGTIRAGYITYPPALMKDTKTGQFSGIFYETLEKAADNLGLKVKWTEEVGWGSQIEGLQTNRYDIIGSPVWANPTRGKLTTMSVPVYYSGIGIYVRPVDDERFMKDWSKINSADVRIATIDGETGDLIARTDFPAAKRVSLPQLTDISQLFLEVTTKKADVLFAEPYYAYEFLKSNPNSIKNIASERPIRTLGNCYMFKSDEFQFKQMLDVAIEDLLNSGFVDRVIDKYEPAPNTFYRVARPYRLK
jgi:polar amino acid transport system substrate-binding protein